MSNPEYETVLEAKVGCDLTLHLDETAGEDLHREITAVLDDCDAVRYVDSLHIEQAYQQEEY